MAYTTIDDPEAYFQVEAYTGNGSDGRTITLSADTDMQPDFVWIKNRDEEDAPCIFDSVRGANKYLQTSSTLGELDQPSSGYVSGFASDGFTVTSGTADDNVNKDTETYVAWCWKESATAGFDILTFEGNATDDTDISHNLSAVPHFMIVRNFDAAKAWNVYHHKNTAAPETDLLVLNTDAATTDTNDRWSDEAPTSSVFTVGDSSQLNASSETSIAYLWSEKQGYSKFGTFTGNGNDDGPFIYTGFRPAWTMIKCTSAADHWPIDDNKRAPHNFMQTTLRANLTNADYTGAAYGIDFLSNGFKVRNDDGQYNLSGGTFVYMAFAEAPLVNSNGVPNNAR
jgi:hypothetical protein